MKEILLSLFSGIIGILLTIGYQHFFSPSQSFTFIYNGEEMVVTESDYTEIMEENELLKKEINENRNKFIELEKQIEDQQAKINQQNSEEEINKIIQSATEYGNSFDYVQALSILNNVENKTSEINFLINDYTQKYESIIIEQVNNLKTEEKLDEASNLINDAINILPDSQILKDKLQEIKNSYPKNMIDVVPAYQNGGNTYTEYTSAKSGASEYFSMGGVKYTNGMTFNADINIFDDVSWAVYNLNGEYTNLDFIVGHVDNTYNGNETALEIFYDGQLKEEIPLAPDMLPTQINLDITGVKQLKMQVRSSGNDNPIYGLGNPIIK